MGIKGWPLCESAGPQRASSSCVRVLVPEGQVLENDVKGLSSTNS